MKKNIIYYAIVGTVFLIGLVVLLISPKVAITSTNARYKVSLDNSEKARVAKWNVIALDKKGNKLDLNVGFKEKLDGGSVGNWFFEIRNESEVSACLDDNSSIILKLYHNDFLGMPEEISWNFLDGDNPITFEVTLYSLSASEILEYKNTNSGEVISYDEYLNGVNDGTIDSSLYEEIIKEITDSNKKTLVMSTNNEMTFTRTLTDGKISYECSVPLTDLIAELKYFGVSTDKVKTFQLSWIVGDATMGSGTGVTNKYKAYKLVDDITDYTIVSGTSSTGYYIDGKRYYVAYQEKDYFDYLNVFGEEPAFKFPSTSGIITDTIKVSYRKLTQEQKDTINNYETPTGTSTKDILEKYIEKLTYIEYTRYENDRALFEKDQGYLGYGFNCSIVFNIRVSQVD